MGDYRWQNSAVVTPLADCTIDANEGMGRAIELARPLPQRPAHLAGLSFPLRRVTDGVSLTLGCDANEEHSGFGGKLC